MKLLKHVTWRRVLLVVAVVAVILQLVPVDRTNPPVVSEIAAPTAVHEVLRRACYDCHSNETRWPWYAYVAPVSWLVAKDVHDGRRHLNFSTWGTYIADKQEAKIQEIWEVVSEEEMPLPIYLPMHPEAKLSDADRAALQQWAVPELP
jgi:hypothetical protein